MLPFVRTTPGRWLAACAAWLAALCCASGQEAVPAVTDAQVDAAVQKGLEFLFRTQQSDGTWSTKYSLQHAGGGEALVVLAALSAGQKADQPNVAAAIKYLDRVDPPTVYARAFRAMVYARLQDPAYAERLRRDVDWLLKQQDRGGGWGYGPGHPTTQLRPRWTDASNSQIAMLALGMAARAGANVPSAVWQRSLAYWTASQNPDGGWGYEPPSDAPARLRGSSYGSMTAAGRATLVRIAEWAASEDSRTGKSASLAAGLDRSGEWLARNYNLDAIAGWVWGSSDEYMHYYYHCLARAAAASGMRMIGEQDWWPQMAAKLVSSQAADGAWADAANKEQRQDAVVRTAFAILAICEARPPVLMNRLAVGNGAEPLGLDALAASRWYSRFVAPASWQKFDLADPPGVLDEAPLLLVVLSDGRMPGEAQSVLRDYVHRGGTILVQPAVSEAAVVQFAKEYFTRLLPEFHAIDLPKDHPLFSARYAIAEAQRPGLLAVGDSARTPVLIFTSDVAGAWRQDRKDSPAFALLANIVAFTTDNSPLGGKLDARRLSPPAAASAEPQKWIPVARIRHGGGFDVCPGAFARLSDAVASAVSVGVKEQSPVDLRQPVPQEIRLLWLTGTSEFSLTAPQKQVLGDYLRAGGMLVIDSAMGRDEFFNSAMAMVQQMLPSSPLQPIALSSPLLTGKFAGGLGSEVVSVHYTRWAPAELQKAGAPRLLSAELDGRPAVVLSRYGITCPMEGHRVYGCMGLQHDDALRLAANLVLYAATK